MTDNKPIMIDGVNVGKCIFYQANFEEDFDVKIKHFCSNWHNSCESVNNNNCYFKQLKRKTQECEELKKDIERWKSNFNGKVSAIEELLQQLDQLKEELQKYQDWFDEFKLMFRYDDREPDNNSELYSCLESVVDENKKLKQTLTEIKKIADLSIAHFDIDYLKQAINEILQITSEVENDK